MISEIFKTVPNYENYMVSNFGRIFSSWQSDNYKELKLNVDNNGYVYVSLCDGLNKPKKFKVHILVMKSFVGEKPMKNICVRHLNGDKLDNSLNNLSYGTYKENEDDKKNHGSWNKRITNCKLSPEQVNTIREKFRTGNYTHYELSVEFKVSRPTITRVINKKIWREI